MEITQLLFEQTSGVFFVWKTGLKTQTVTFLRNRKDVSTQSQIDKAILDGRVRAWELTGIGHWWIQPIVIREITEPGSSPKGQQRIDIIYSITASLLSLKKLPERERRSTEQGVKVMHEEYIPIVRERIRKILLESLREDS